MTYIGLEEKRQMRKFRLKWIKTIEKKHIPVKRKKSITGIVIHGHN
ncbi:MAG: hypothetical protein L6420_10315 [Elusimicrobia bacterium]|nr:hypothetical protein [Elusimicrobiota bacterium]